MSLAAKKRKPKEQVQSRDQVRSELLAVAAAVETVQDFLIKLGIKPPMHLLEIYHVIVRPTKIMKRADKNWAHSYKVL